MSEQNVELQRRLTKSFNARDIEAFIACCDPEVELHAPWTVPGGAVYRGYDGLRKWHQDLEDAWGGEIRVDSEKYFDLGEQVLHFYVIHGRGRQSGAEAAMPVAAVGRWHDGLCVYFKAYVHREDALKDLGVSEDALEPIAP